MNSRVKTLFGVFAFGLCASFMTHADELGWDALKSEKIDIEVFSSGQGKVLSSYPAFLQKILTRALDWDPRKELNNSTQLASVLKSYESAKQGDRRIDLSEMFRNLSVQFDVSDTTHFRKFWFKLNSQLKVRGLFGFHDFQKRRPLIILRMGIHGNVDELLAERFIAKAVYEDLDANFLILENLTSYAFLRENSQMSFGGVEEGLHTYFILNELTKPGSYFPKITTSFHLVGVSLGGQGTFVTALLDHYNQRNIKSVLDFCPLINLQSTFDEHAQKSLKDAVVDIWNFQRLKTIYANYSDQLKGAKVWKTFFDFKPRFTPRILQILNAERLTPLLSAEDLKIQNPKMIWPEGFYDLITKSKSFYEMNDFWKTFKGVETPITVYTTPKDFLVMNDLNSDMILEGKQPGTFNSVKIEKLERGMHCGLASAYMWDDVVKMIKTGLQL